MLRSASFLAVTIILLSCKNASPGEKQIYESMNNGIDKSINFVTTQNSIQYNIFDRKKSDPATAAKAKNLSAAVDSIRLSSDEIVKYIHVLKYEIDELAVKKEKNGDEMEKFSLEKTKADELFKKLLAYKTAMLNIIRIFKDGSQGVIMIDSTEDIFYEKYFDNKPLIAEQIMLSKLENDIRIMENTMISYFNNLSCSIIESFDVFSVLVSQSSNIVKAGDVIKIQAGVGAFSSTSKPTLLIDGKVLKSENQNSFVVYTFNAPQKAGKYSKRIAIEFIKADGTKEKAAEVIEYTVKE